MSGTSTATIIKFDSLLSTALPVSRRAKCYFVAVYAVSSMNYGFVRFKSFKVRASMTVLFLCQIFLVNVLIFYFEVASLESKLLQFWYILNLLEYCVLTLGLFFWKQSTISDFWDSFVFLDNILKNNNGMRVVEIVMISLSLYCFAFRIVTSVVYCTWFVEYCIKSKVVIVIFHIVLICNDTFLVVYFILYLLVYIYLKKLVSYVANCNYDVIFCQYLYKYIIDSTERGKLILDLLYLFLLVAHSGDLLLTVFYPLLIEKKIKKSGSEVWRILAGNVSLGHTVVLLFAPPLAAGFILGITEKLKLILQDRLFLERECQHVADIKSFVKYIQARPFRFKICRVIPLDWTLPVIILNICITYLIVMMQFTHIF